ncbi:MAG: glycerol-3-phosphate 1-O-acyltransferase [Pseudomonadota bacterium]
MSERNDVSPWPANDDLAPVLFILDAGHDVETGVLAEWLARHEPDYAKTAPASQAVLSIARNQESIDSTAIAAQLGKPDETIVVPLRVVWSDDQSMKRRAPRVRDLIFRPRKPTRKRAAEILASSPERVACIFGASATLGDLRTRFAALDGASVDPRGLADFIADQAGLVLDIAERQLRGGRYKVPRRVATNLKNSRRYREALDAVAAETGEPIAALQRRAEEIFKELIAIPRTFWQDVLAVFNRKVISMGYDPELVIDEEQLRRVREMVRTKPAVLLWTHKTHIDGFAVYSMLFENDFPVPHLLGGVNMAFAGLGYAARRSGGIFIRRSFQDDPLYKMILRQYIGYLLEKRFPLTWAFEGTRSRVGKLMPPRYGLLKYVVEAAHVTESKDLHIIPVALNYDLIGDVKDYVREQSGAVKQPESLKWFLGYLRGLRRPLGKIYIDFGEPVVLEEPPSGEDLLALKKTALQVGVEANRVTPITLASLVCTILLGVAPRALTRLEIGKQMLRMVRWARQRNIRIASDFDRDSSNNLNMLADVLGDDGLITRFDEGPDVVYTIAPEQHRVASYYRNTTIHHFVTKAIAELSLLAVVDQEEDRVAAFFDEAGRLRDLFKFEFFYAPSDAFLNELDEEMQRYDSDWRQSLATDPEYPKRRLRQFTPLVSRSALLPFVEAYQVVCNVVARLPSDAGISAKECLEQSLALGKQAYLQRRISSEASIGKLLFENAYRLLEHNELIHPGEVGLGERRRQISATFRDLAQRLETIRLLTLPGDRW